MRHTGLLAVCALTLFFASTLRAEEQARPIHLYVIGDSTAASYEAKRAPLTGWAQVLQEHFDPAKLVVENKARSGRSSKSFFEEGAWAEIETVLEEGDYVFIQFGHNDSKQDDPKRYTDPKTTYRDFLTRYVNETRAKGAVPVLLTSIYRDHWKDGKTLVDSHGEYPPAVRELAATLQVPLLDVHKLTADYFSGIGPEGTRRLFLYLDKGASPNYPEGKEDSTHLQEAGARAVSRLVVDEIRRLQLPIAACLK